MRFCCMKKIFTFLMLLIFVSVSTTACSHSKTPKQNMIQSKRRFADYVEPQTQNDPTRIDLSEGQKLKYDAKFGPKKLDFDIKIIDPY